jgi:hypothetical protein
MPSRTIEPEHRQDLHNTAIDELAAVKGACAEIHLQTGRTCTLPCGHEGSCDFVSPGEVAGSLAERVG